MGPLIDAEM
jgi:predicted TIM-barrel fold metal-dependent hydrolase